MQDILHTSEGFTLKDGDLAIGESTLQDVERIIICAKGEQPLSLLTGVNINTKLNGITGNVKMKKILRTELKKDGFKRVDFSMVGNELTVSAKR